MEIWKEIEGFPEYQISNQGRVKSLKTNIIMKPRKSGSGYFHIGLYDDIIKKYKYHMIHRLVAFAFIQNIENKQTVDHIDRNKENNCVENLRWATPSEQAINSNISYKGTNTNQKNIHLCKRNYYYVQIKRFNHIIRKRFKTLEEAIIFRDDKLAKLEENTNQTQPNFDLTPSQQDQ